MPSINFILLDETASPNKTVEIIKAIGSTWPFLLTVSGIIFLIIYRKEIGRFLSKFSKISTKSIAGELSFERTNVVTAATEEFVAPKGSHFIVRMKPNWLPVKEFLRSRKQDMIVSWKN
jgi:hypothetical protein